MKVLVPKGTKIFTYRQPFTVLVSDGKRIVNAEPCAWNGTAVRVNAKRIDSLVEFFGTHVVEFNRCDWLGDAWIRINGLLMYGSNTRGWKFIKPEDVKEME